MIRVISRRYLKISLDLLNLIGTCFEVVNNGGAIWLPTNPICIASCGDNSRSLPFTPAATCAVEEHARLARVSARLQQIEAVQHPIPYEVALKELSMLCVVS